MAAGGIIVDDASTCRNALIPSRGGRIFYFSGTMDSMMQKTVKTLAELEEEAARFARSLVKSEQRLPAGRQATLVTLSGELGAGKTAFTKAVARALGVEEVVTSPTFVLEKIYILPQASGHISAFKRLIHIDAYRLSSGSELAPLGFDELMRDEGNLVMLEWPEKVADALPVPAVRVSIVSGADEIRDISYA